MVSQTLSIFTRAPAASRGDGRDGALCKLLYSYLVVKLGYFPIDDYVKHW